MKTTKEIQSELNANGFANYKASVVLCSDTMPGWFMDKAKTTFAPSLSELLFDLNDLQINVDYDAKVSESKAILNQFKAAF